MYNQRKNSQDVPILVKVDFFSEKFRKINKTGKNKNKANFRWQNSRNNSVDSFNVVIYVGIETLTDILLKIAALSAFIQKTRLKGFSP